MPECWDDMVQCELCDKWLYMSREGLKSAPEGEWVCTVCRLPDSKRLRNCYSVYLIRKSNWDIFVSGRNSLHYGYDVLYQCWFASEEASIIVAISIVRMQRFDRI